MAIHPLGIVPRVIRYYLRSSSVKNKKAEKAVSQAEGYSAEWLTFPGKSVSNLFKLESG